MQAITKNRQLTILQEIREMKREIQKLQTSRQETKIATLASLQLSKADLLNILEHNSKLVTLERMEDFVISVIDNVPASIEHTNYEKILHLSRAAYLQGFENAVETYSEAVDMKLQEAREGE
ncbi:MAG: hypothetical protein FWG63_05005 [Defluviitaleaceae bacterium]|nr:hypothetical protein [Defluviitaleaceae bacterium]